MNKQHQQDIIKYSDQFLTFFSKEKFKTLFIEEDEAFYHYNQTEKGVSLVEKVCIALLILKHINPKNKIFLGINKEFEDEKKYLEILKKATPKREKLEWYRPSYKKAEHELQEYCKKNNIEPLIVPAGTDIKILITSLASKKLKKRHPIDYFFESFYNSIPEHLYKENFNHFIIKILTKMLLKFSSQNSNVGSLIAKFLKDNKSKNILSLDGAYILNLWGVSEKIDCNTHYNDQEPTTLIKLLSFFANKKTAFVDATNSLKIKINKKYDSIIMKVDETGLSRRNSELMTIDHDNNVLTPEGFEKIISETKRARTPSGLAIFLVEKKYLFEQGSLENLKYIVDNNFLKGVIYLKSYLLLLLQKSTETAVFFEGGDYIIAHPSNTPKERFKFFLDAEKLYKDFIKQKQPNTHCAHLKETVIKRWHYNIEQRKVYEHNPLIGTPLVECAEILEGKTTPLEKILNTDYIIKIGDLSKDASSLIIAEDPNLSHINNAKFKKITKDALLIATRWRALKPTMFEYKGKPIYISNNIAAIRPIDGKTSIEYLLYELNKKEKSGAFRNLRRGQTIPYITHEDILHNIKIDLPSLNKQKEILVHKYKEKISSLQTKAKVKKLELERSAIEDFDNIDHRIRTDLSKIKTATMKLQGFFKDNEKLEKSVSNKFKKDYNENIFAPLNNIKAKIEKSTKLLEAIGKKSKLLDSKEYPFENINVNELFKKIKSNIKNNPHDPFSLTVTQNYQPEQHEDKFIKANWHQLEDMFDELLTNTRKYAGFNNEKRGEVKITLSIPAPKKDKQEEKLELSFENNGAPFPPTINKEEYIKYKVTIDPKNSNGYGGSMVKDICKHYGIDWDLKSKPKNKYPVKFIFKFQIHELD